MYKPTYQTSRQPLTIFLSLYNVSKLRSPKGTSISRYFKQLEITNSIHKLYFNIHQHIISLIVIQKKFRASFLCMRYIIGVTTLKTIVVYMSSMILQLAAESHGLSQAEKRKEKNLLQAELFIVNKNCLYIVNLLSLCQNISFLSMK